MRKGVLTDKCFRGKRAELWFCEKAAGVQVGTTTVHNAGRYVGEFRVVATKRCASITEALLWRPHTLFLPSSTSFDNTIEYYRRLFSLCRADESNHTFYAWEDELLHRYIVDQDLGRVYWEYPMQRCTRPTAERVYQNLFKNPDPPSRLCLSPLS